MKPWTHKGKPVTEIPEGIYGFVYLITDNETRRKYIGKKFAWAKKTKQVKGKKKKFLAESDWKTYFGSSKELTEEIEEYGTDLYDREILHFCETRAECGYMETWEIFRRGALLSGDYYNSWVSCKIHGRHVTKISDRLREKTGVHRMSTMV